MLPDKWATDYPVENEGYSGLMKSRIIRVKASAGALRLPTGIFASLVRSIYPFPSGFVM
jgi:hypothetical protein